MSHYKCFPEAEPRLRFEMQDTAFTNYKRMLPVINEQSDVNCKADNVRAVGRFGKSAEGHIMDLFSLPREY